jgi:2-polyprenyl-3-methyl-5-hydroxy-6-metoxy-1,4-benzoquinol methylase
MNRQEFTRYKAHYLSAIRRVLTEASPGSLDEAGFPAYSHPNLLINFLFWQRIHKVMDFLSASSPYEKILDFGCGSGVMLPFLSMISQQVVAVDVDLKPLELVRQYIEIPENVKVYDAKQFSPEKYSPATFDIIVALDVLEHVDELDQTLSHLCSLLKPGGQIVISGPTENLLYQIGRKLAGPEYSGDYHERGIADIKNALKPLSRIREIVTLWPILPLFEIFTATP